MVSLALEEFNKSIEKAVSFFNSEFLGNSPVKIISHLDADGICSAAIMIKALSRLNISYSLSILPQLDQSALYSISKESFSRIIFTDLGSGQLSLIEKFLNTRKVIVLDHHQPEHSIKTKICHINPHLYGLDGSREISGSGVVFMFAKGLDNKNTDLAYLAVIGAIGDNQESNGFSGINDYILKTAIESGKISVEKGLRFFGQQTKPLHKLLEYSTDFIIPGVTGSESGAIQFLQNIGINPKKGTSWKKLTDLAKDEKIRLVDAILLKRNTEEKPDEILGNIYLLPSEKQGPLRDAKEFSTLLNACGRMSRASFGIGACLGDEKSKRAAIRTLNDYKKQIIESLSWLSSVLSSKSGSVISGKGFLIINAGFNVPATIIGTITSIISMSGSFNIKDGTYIISMARTENSKTKISSRFAGKSKHENLKKLMDRCISSIDGQSGGHENAAGAIIPSSDESLFIKNAISVLRRISKEELLT